jgi:hypothetical protein
VNIARSAALLAMCGFLAVPLAAAAAAAAESGAEADEVPTTVMEASLRAARTAAVPLSPSSETTSDDAAAAPLTAPAADYADDQFERLNESALQAWWRSYQRALERAE